MSMTGSHPTEDYTATMASFARSHGADKPTTVLGQCFDENGKRYEVYFNGEDHDTLYKSMDAQANPEVVYAKITDWFKTHAGHMLTHCGGVISDKGSADVWFCQKDKVFCFDDVS